MKKSIVCLLFLLCFIFTSSTPYIWAGGVYLASDDTYVGGNPKLAPDGSYVGSGRDW